MTADTENLVLDHLRHIRARVDQIADTATKPLPATNHHRPADRPRGTRRAPIGVERITQGNRPCLRLPRNGTMRLRCG